MVGDRISDAGYEVLATPLHDDVDVANDPEDRPTKPGREVPPPSDGGGWRRPLDGLAHGHGIARGSTRGRQSH